MRSYRCFDGLTIGNRSEMWSGLESEVDTVFDEDLFDIVKDSLLCSGIKLLETCWKSLKKKKSAVEWVAMAFVSSLS